MNTADVTRGKSTALSHISELNTINPLVAFYDIHTERGVIPRFYPGHHKRHNLLYLLDLLAYVGFGVIG
jgi:hypothetical protein